MSFRGRSLRAIGRLAALLPSRADALVGAVAGASAFLVGFGLIYLVEGVRVRSPSQPLLTYFSIGADAVGETNVGPEGPLPAAYQFAAWQYHALHGVDLTYGLTGVAPSRPLVVVPALAMLAGGALVVARRGADGPWTAAKRGSVVAVGALPLALLTAVTATWAPPGGITIVVTGVGAGEMPLDAVGLQTVEAAVLSGLAAPIAFGAIGGYVAFAHRADAWPTPVLRRGLLYGVAAFAAGWAAAFVRTVDALDRPEVDAVSAIRYLPESGSESVIADGVLPGEFVLATWQFHGLQRAAVDVRYLGAVRDGVDELTVFELEGAVVFVAPVVLALAGAALVARVGASSLRVGAVRGAAVVVGYLPLAVLSALATAWTPAGAPAIAVGVALSDAFLVTGIAVPAVCGALGGVAVAAKSLVVEPGIERLRSRLPDA